MTMSIKTPGKGNQGVAEHSNTVSESSFPKIQSEIDRRRFLQTCTAGGLLAAGSGLVAPFTFGTPGTSAAAGVQADGADQFVWNSCFVNCGSRCLLKCHVKEVDNKKVLYRITTDDSPSDEFGHHQNRACLRGRSARKRVYNPDRLLYPMKRVGKRGEGKFERISWDDAVKIIGEKLKYTIEKYSNEAVYYSLGSGNNGYRSDGRASCRRLLKLMGGYLSYYNEYSYAQMQRAMPFTFGGSYEGDLQQSLSREMGNAKLVVSFGYNPSETRMSGGGETYLYSEWLRKNNVRTILIDPRYTDSALGKEDEWIPIRPGTDAALVEAIAYVLITENMVDEAFLEKYCVGYDEKTLPASAPANGHYKAHILGQGADGIVKTPQWAAGITGIPVERIVKLAREIGQTEPVFFTQGWGIQRQANGEQACRAICMLPMLTGNIGLPGTNMGDQPGNYGYSVPGLPEPANKVKAAISVFTWTDAIKRGKEMTALKDGVQGVDKLNQSIKFFWSYASGVLINQHSDANETHKILQDESLCEFIVVIDNHMTSSARYADILLPDVTNFENSDIIGSGYAAGEMGGPIFVSQAIEPLGECKSAYNFCTEIARYLGIEEEYTEGKTHDDWVRAAYETMKQKDVDLPADFETARAMGMIKRRAPEGTGIAYAAFRKDPVANPVPTPSGKFEIYSEELAKIAATWELQPGDVITPLPQYVATWEGAEDYETKKEFPLQMHGFHTKGRTHSTYHNVDVLRQAVSDAVWINPVDAQPRGIKDGDTVHVKNKRGVVQVLAKVTPRVMPGVVSLGQGAWYRPDANGVDVGGCINTLTSHRPSPLAKGNPQHTNLVEIQRVA